MARPSAHEWDICKNQECTHTINIHTHNDEVGVCGAYKCGCPEFIKKEN